MTQVSGRKRLLDNIVFTTYIAKRSAFTSLDDWSIKTVFSIASRTVNQTQL